MKLTHFAKIEQGKLILNNSKRFSKEIAMFSGDVILTIEKKSKKRSSLQNRFYRGVVLPLFWEGLTKAGYKHSLEETHEIIKSLFNKAEFLDLSSGEITQFGRSTTELTTTQFMEFIMAIQQYAAEHLDIYIPDPLEGD